MAWIDPDSLEDMKKVSPELYERMRKYRQIENLALAAMAAFSIAIVLLVVIGNL